MTKKKKKSPVTRPRNYPTASSVSDTYMLIILEGGPGGRRGKGGWGEGRYGHRETQNYARYRLLSILLRIRSTVQRTNERMN